MLHTFAVGESRSVTSTENDGANGKVEFIDDARAKERVVEGAAAFAQEPLHLPLFAQPAECFNKIDLVPSAHFDFIREGLKLAQIAIGNAFADEDHDGRKAVFEDFRPGIQGAGAA